MAIQIKQAASFMWPVEVMLPKSGGDFDKFTFDIEFRRLSTDEWQSLIEKMSEGKTDFTGIARKIVSGWGPGVEDEPGVPLPFSDAALGQLLNIVQVPSAIFAAYAKAQNGAAREKN